MSLPRFYWIFLIFCCAYALWKGGPPERMAIGIAIIASVLTVVAVSPDLETRFRNVEAGIFLVDVATLFAFLLLALCADRFWPLWITGLHLVGLATHSAMLLSPDVVPWVYAWTQALWAYPILLLIVIGAARHRKRLKLYGGDSSWTNDLAFSGRPRR